MSVRVPPGGTRGDGMSRRLWRISNAIGTRFYRLGLKAPKAVMLTTKGAQTGQERSVTVRGFDEDAGAILVVGSKGGSATHPAWFINIAKNPDAVWVDVKGRRLKVTPATLEGAERATAWKRIVAEAPNFGGYETKTDREMPVVRLTPER